MRDPAPGTAIPRLLEAGFLFLAGDPSLEHARQVLEQIPPLRWIVAPGEAWVEHLIAHWDHHLEARRRWSLSDYVTPTEQPGVPPGVTLQALSPDVAAWLLPQLGIEALPNFPDLQALCDVGGCVVLVEGRPVAASCAFAAQGRDVDVAVATHQRFRGQGHAQLAAFMFVQSCLRKNLKPNWDTDHACSLHIARRIGFVNPRPYDAYMRYPPIEELEALLAS